MDSSGWTEFCWNTSNSSTIYTSFSIPHCWKILSRLDECMVCTKIFFDSGGFKLSSFSFLHVSISWRWLRWKIHRWQPSPMSQISNVFIVLEPIFCKFVYFLAHRSCEELSSLPPQLWAEWSYRCNGDLHILHCKAFTCIHHWCGWLIIQGRFMYLSGK